MVYRVLAGFVPMILGWMIYSGAIPVRRWVMGNSVPAPEQLLRQAARAHGAGGKQDSGGSDLERVVDAQESVMSQAVETDRMVRELQRASEDAELRRRERARHPASTRPGWGPTGGWSAR